MQVANLPRRPRPYQVESAIKFSALAVQKRAAGGRAVAIIVYPTGCGKTFEAYLLALSMGLRCLFVTITDALCAQVEEEVRRLFPKIRIGVVKAERDEYRGMDFVLASAQTLGKEERLARCVAGWAHDGKPPELIVIDECHGAFSGGSFHRICEAIPQAHVVGLTATPERTDGKPLGDVFPDGVVYRLEVKHAVDQEYLVAVSDGAGGKGKSRRVVVHGLDEALVRMADSGKDPLDEDAEERPRTSIADKKRALTPEEKEKLRKAVVKATSDSVVEACATFKRKVLAFTLNVRCAKDVATEAQARGVRCAYVHGQMAREEYRQLGEDFKDEQGLLGALRTGRLQALANCQVLIFGYDDPSIDGIVWGRPTMSRLLWCQGIGRGMRLDPARPMRLGPPCPTRGVPTGELNPAGKRDVIVWDLVGAHEIHGLQTAENIFAPEKEDAAAPGVDDAEALLETVGGGTGGGAVDRERDLLLNFVRALSGRARPSATRGSRVSWLPVEEGNCYAIPREDPEGPTFTIERAGGGWVAFAEAPGWVDTPAVRLTGVVSERDAKAACESASDAGSGFGDRGAGWRFGKPSARMMAAAKRLRIPVPNGVSAGAVADAISAKVALVRRRSRPERGIVTAGAALLD